MKKTVTIDTDITYTNGPAYITVTARKLGRWDHPEHPGSSDWSITVIVAMSVQGRMEVYWRQNAEWAQLDHGDLPKSVLVDIRKAVRDIALEIDKSELHALADYCDDVEGEGE